jgi:metal-responsive CopG/Arc/MetJ family transcriptional regulator
MMNDGQELLENIKALVRAKRYRVRLHAVRHMIEEGFSEENLLEAITGKCRVLENYPDESRCLILGYF